MIAAFKANLKSIDPDHPVFAAEKNTAITAEPPTPAASEENGQNQRKAHSVKVPRLYKEASKALQNIEENGEGLKTAIYSIKHPNKKALTALVSETLRHNTQLEMLLEKAKIREQEPGLAVPLAKILITELIWGKKRLGGDAKPIQTIMKYGEKFNTILSKIERKNRSKGITESECGIESRDLIRKPRYVRVNTLVSELSEVLEYFENEGWFQKDTNDVSQLSTNDFFVDPFVENLLVFSPQTEFHSHPLYLNGSLVLQDKASCLPALALKPRRGRQVLDACAAPGMKTSLLAGLMGNEGSIIAIEKSERRCNTLKSMMEHLGATCVTVEHKDFTDVNPADHPDVEYILVDPSCSGSGMYGRIDVSRGNNCNYGSSSTDIDFRRLESLAFCQKKLLMHAMRFPGVKKIVYSTCSLHSVENEDVVAAALDESEDADSFRIKIALPDWPHRLINPKYQWSDMCVSADFEKSATDGFFVAVLEKVKVKKSKKSFDEEY